MKTKYVLLVIGILGLAAGIYGAIKDQSISSNLISIICGASLILGYWELNKKE